MAKKMNPTPTASIRIVEVARYEKGNVTVLSLTVSQS